MNVADATKQKLKTPWIQLFGLWCFYSEIIASIGSLTKQKFMLKTFYFNIVNNAVNEMKRAACLCPKNTILNTNHI